MKVFTISVCDYDESNVIAVVDSMDKLPSMLQDHFGDDHEILSIKPVDQFYEVKVNAKGLDGQVETSNLWCEPFTVNKI